jgi:hypothetical protein
VFPDCALWTGSDLDWMMTGTRDAAFARDEAAFRAQWEDPVVGPELRATGLERPEQLGALFLADAPFLAELTAQTPPLVDDWPKRVSDAPVRRNAAWWKPYRFLMDTRLARERFRASAFVEAAWPPALREATLPWFEAQRLQTPGQRREERRGRPLAQLGAVHRVLTGTGLETLPRWVLGTGDDELAIAAREVGDPPVGEAAYHLALGALAARDWRGAADALLAIEDAASIDSFAPWYTVYALCMAERGDEAAAVARISLPDFRDAGDDFCAALGRGLTAAPARERRRGGSR